MSLLRLTGRCAVALACIGMLAAPLQANQIRPSGRGVIADVAMQSGGVINGAVVNPQGHKRAGSTVTVLLRGQVVSRVETDREGRFRVANLRGGIYQFQTTQGVSTVRVWAERTAPPSAARELLIVEQGEIVRGQGPGHGNQIMSCLSNPLVLAGIVAVAIAVPLALDDDNATP